MNVIYDTGLQFGWCAFTTIALYNNTPLFLQEHLQRLEVTCNFLNITFKEDLIKEKIHHYLQTNQLSFHALKVLISEKNIILTHRENPYTKERNLAGFKITTTDYLRNDQDPFTYHKTGNYGLNILAKQKAQAQGFDEVIFCNTKGEITEGSTTNIFLYLEDKLITPPLTSGLLPGIMRQKIINEFKIQAKIITMEDLEQATAIFLTNSLMGMMPVKTLNHRQLNTDYPFPLLNAQLKRYK